MPKPVIRAVFKREVKSWFGNPTGYVFILFFALLAAVLMVRDGFFDRNLANLDTLSAVVPWLLLVFAPVITMGLWADERRSGTQELLFTLPARDIQILLGKYLATVAIYTVSLAFTFVLPLGLFAMGDPDIGLVASTYLGYWLLGLVMLAVAMLGSQLSQNLALSFLFGLLFCLAVFRSDYIAFLLSDSLGRSWGVYSPLGMFEDLRRGLLTPAALLVFLGWTSAFLYLNWMLLRMRTVDSAGEFAVHRVVRGLALLVLFSSVGVWSLNHLPSQDVTVEGLHELSEQSTELLDDLDEDRPVLISAYISEEVPQAYLRTRRELMDKLQRFDREGGAAVQVRIVEPKPLSDEGAEAEDNYGIEMVSIRDAVNPQDFSAPVVEFYLGFVVQCGTEEIVKPHVRRNTPVEYELMRSIRVVAQAKRRKVGVLKTDAEITAGFDMQRMRQRPAWPIFDELRKQYDVVVDVDATRIPDGLDLLFVPMVSSLTQPEMDALGGYIAKGKPTLLIDDPFPATAPGTSATDPKRPPPQNPMMQQQRPPQPPPKGSVDALLRRFDISFPYQELVFDQNNPHPALNNAQQPEMMFLEARVDDEFRPLAGLNQDEAITKGLKEVVVLFGGRVAEVNPKDDLTFTPLLRTSKSSGTLKKDDLFRQSFMGMALNTSRQHKVDEEQHVVAARITGTTEAKEKVDVAFLADIDMISPGLFMMREQGVGDLGIQFDNVTFILNTIDAMVGDMSFVELRKRRAQHRSLERLEEEQRVFDERWNEKKDEAEVAAKKELEDAEQRLKDKVAEIETSTMDQRAKAIRIQEVRNQEQRKLDLAKAQIEEDKKRAIRRAQANRDAQIDSIRLVYQVGTVALAGVPALIMGIIVLIRRSTRENRIVPDNRMKRGEA